MQRSISGVIAALFLAGCGGGLPPSIDADGVDADRLTGRQFTKFATTARADLPTGAATYDGGLGGQITGDLEGRIVADLSLDVHFDRATLTGDISNINITDRDGVPTQRFGGQLDVTGTRQNGALTAQSEGGLRVTDADGNIGRSDIAFVLDGDVRTRTNDGDAIAGETSGSLSGDLNLRIFDGYFYGARN